MFLRVKKIKGKEYCYLVKNVWTKNGARQEVKGYLGRSHAFDQDEKDFFDYQESDSSAYLTGKSRKDILGDLAAWELAKAGFDQESNKLLRDGMTFDKKRLELKKNGRNVVVKVNEGFLCGFTLRRLLRFKKSDEIEHDSVKLAKFFVEAGIDVPQELFIGFFEKL